MCRARLKVIRGEGADQDEILCTKALRSVLAYLHCGSHSALCSATQSGGRFGRQWHCPPACIVRPAGMPICSAPPRRTPNQTENKFHGSLAVRVAWLATRAGLLAWQGAVGDAAGSRRAVEVRPPALRRPWQRNGEPRRAPQLRPCAARRCSGTGSRTPPWLFLADPADFLRRFMSTGFEPNQQTNSNTHSQVLSLINLRLFQSRLGDF